MAGNQFVKYASPEKNLGDAMKDCLKNESTSKTLRPLLLRLKRMPFIVEIETDAF